ncbi:fimbrial protein [Erwinia sp. HR93]|uniref:fimbrial protein n=1 Tax=Erwinia sp. HR93 TaxID=3094840 RepID=UPI002ADEA715|nr:fimbrial protein [Erwinia sp. HR93]MEA1062446.1 fimbrial protein [Erwinia sp. HR93]
MKAIFSVVAASLLMAGISTANASDGTIVFNGELTDATCDVTVNGGSNDATVTLPTLSATMLAAADATAGDTDFVINLKNCNPATGKVRAFFEAGNTVDMTNGRLKNMQAQGAAGNVQLELLNEGGTSLKVGDTGQRANAATDLNAGTADLPYIVRYHATDKTSAGKVTSSVTYSIDYE